MKNFFGVNKTDKNNTAYDGQVFLRQSVPPELAQRMDENTEALVNKVVSIPRLLLAVAPILVGGVLLQVFFELLDQEGATPNYILLGVGVACFLLSGLLFWWDHRRTNAVMESDEFQTLETEMESAAASSRMLLGVPADAADLEALGYDYVVKRGKEKPTGDGYAYETCCLFAFVENGELLLADSEDKYAIPLSEVTAVRYRREKAKVWLWMKDEEPKSEAYKPYGIKYDEENDIYTLPAVVSLEITRDGQGYELLVPPYEWERVLQPLTGLTATGEE